MFPRCCAHRHNLHSGSSVQFYADVHAEQLCGQALALLSIQGSHQPAQEVVVVESDWYPCFSSA